MKDYTVLIRLPRDLQKPLEEQAKLLGIGVATLVRMLLLEVLRKKNWGKDAA